MDSRVTRRGRGRPRGEPLVPYAARFSEAEMRDLRLLQQVLVGKPSLNGILREALVVFKEQILEDPRMRARYESLVAPSLKVVK
jgi:hypothetical protein